MSLLTSSKFCNLWCCIVAITQQYIVKQVVGLWDPHRARSCRASEASAVIMWVGNRLVPHSVNLLFLLHTAKENAISGPGAKQQKWSVPRQWSQNVGAGGPHHRPHQLMASFSLDCHTLVEWGRHNELEASMVGAASSHVLGSLFHDQLMQPRHQGRI